MLLLLGTNQSLLKRFQDSPSIYDELNPGPAASILNYPVYMPNRGDLYVKLPELNQIHYYDRPSTTYKGMIIDSGSSNAINFAFIEGLVNAYDILAFDSGRNVNRCDSNAANPPAVIIPYDEAYGDPRLIAYRDRKIYILSFYDNIDTALRKNVILKFEFDGTNWNRTADFVPEGILPNTDTCRDFIFGNDGKAYISVNNEVRIFNPDGTAAGSISFSDSCFGLSFDSQASNMLYIISGTATTRSIFSADISVTPTPINEIFVIPDAATVAISYFDIYQPNPTGTNPNVSLEGGYHSNDIILKDPTKTINNVVTGNVLKPSKNYQVSVNLHVDAMFASGIFSRQIKVRFWSFNGAAGSPGTLLGETIASITFPTDVPALTYLVEPSPPIVFRSARFFGTRNIAVSISSVAPDRTIPLCPEATNASQVPAPLDMNSCSAWRQTCSAFLILRVIAKLFRDLR